MYFFFIPSAQPTTKSNDSEGTYCPILDTL